MRLIVIRRIFIFIIGIVILALFLMSIDFSFGPIVQTFKNSLAYQQAEKQLMKKYSVLEDTFQFSLPHNWDTMEEAFSGGEIIYNLYFNSNDKKIHGIVQVWDINTPLKQFIDESKKSAIGVVNFKYYRVKEIIADYKPGYLLDYSRKSGEGGYIKAYEAFVEGKDGRIYRVSFFVDEKNWRPQNLILFNRVIRSFAMKG
jgi:hypothetical protein